MKTKTAFFLSLLICLGALACSSPQTVVIGSPEINNGDVQKIKPGSLHIAFDRYMHTYVMLEYQFAQKMNTSPMEGYKALLVQSEFGPNYIAIKEGLYAEQIGMLQKGDIVRVYGRVSATKLPTDQTHKTTIVVDE